MRYHSKRLPRFRRRRKIARRRNGGLSNRLGWINRPRRRNPDPNGRPWGPELYNPLEDTRHPFKNEAEYRSVVKPLYRRNPYGYTHEASEVDQSGLYKSIFSRRHSRRNPYLRRHRKNPYGYAHESSDTGQTGLYKSIFSRRRHRRNPFGQARGEPIGSEASTGTGLYKSIFSRRRHRRNPFGQARGEPIGSEASTGTGLYKSIFSRRHKRSRNRRRSRGYRRHNPLGQTIFDTIDTTDAYWDRGRI